MFQNNEGKRVRIVSKIPYYQTGEVYLLVESKADMEQMLVKESDFLRYFSPVNTQMSTQDKLALFFSLFKGRRDVYAKSFINDQGKVQYWPSYQYGWKQLKPEERLFEPLTGDVLKTHLRGETRIGLFPISKDNTAHLLAVDFDKKDWQEAVKALRQTCSRLNIEPAVKISKSGQGAHVWFFFEEELPCLDIRKFGRKLLELTMQETASVSFDSFDRMFPNQDYLTKGGLGNLIALPLNGQSYQEGRTVFVSEDFMPYEQQWEYLQSLSRVSIQQVQEILQVPLSSGQLSDLQVEISYADQLYFNKRDLSPQNLHALKKLASFANPEFYIKQASRQPTYQTPERIYLYQETDDRLSLPRGLKEEVQKLFPLSEFRDNRLEPRQVNFSFTGKLYPSQEVALLCLSEQDQGVLSAHTGFGKTVLAASLLAKKQCRTIILVHNRQLLEQWQARLQT